MFEVLNSYLFQHKSISIPGLGTIFLERTSSGMDNDNKNFLPPGYHFRFDKYSDAPDKDFFSYLASEQNIPDYEAIKWYNEFSNDLRNRIGQEDQVQWDDVGFLKKDVAGNIIFESRTVSTAFFKPVIAQAIDRQEPASAPADGAAADMDAWLNAGKSKSSRSAWWIIALVVSAIALLILLFHFSSLHGNGSAVGNRQKLEIVK